MFKITNIWVFFQSFFGFGQSADIEIQLDGAETRKMAEMKTEDGKKERYFLYYDGESVSGKVSNNLFQEHFHKVVYLSSISLGYLFIHCYFSKFSM